MGVPPHISTSSKSGYFVSNTWLWGNAIFGNLRITFFFFSKSVHLPAFAMFMLWFPWTWVRFYRLFWLTVPIRDMIPYWSHMMLLSRWLGRATLKAEGKQVYDRRFPEISMSSDQKSCFWANMEQNCLELAPCSTPGIPWHPLVGVPWELDHSWFFWCPSCLGFMARLHQDSALNQRDSIGFHPPALK